jgi:WD40 repeat protein
VKAQQAESDARHKEMELRKELQKVLSRERVNLFHQSVRLAYQYWRDSKLGAAERSLDACPLEFRHWEWHYLKRLCHAELLTLVHRDSVFDVAYSPDGKRLATTSGYDVTIWDAVTGKQLLHLPGRIEDGQTTGLAYSPDGKRLAVAGGNLQGSRSVDGTEEKVEAQGFVRILDAETGKDLLVLRKFGAIVFGVAFSSDGKRLATAGTWTGKPGELRTWDAASGEELLTLNGHTSTVWQVAISPDGKYLASTSGDGTARLWDPATGRELYLLRGQRDAAVGLAFSPDSKRLAISYGSASHSGPKAPKPAELRIWDVSTGALVLSFRASEGVIPRIAFSPDGERLATSGWDRTARLWDAKTGDELMAFRGHREFVNIDFGEGKGGTAARGPNVGSVVSLAFSPDGKRLATAGADYTVRVWDITRQPDRVQFPAESTILGFTADGNNLRTLSGKQLRVRDMETGQIEKSVELSEAPSRPVVSPDGRCLAGSCADGKTKAWNIQTGKGLFAIRGGLAIFSPDGKHLVTALGDQGGFSQEPSVVKLWDAATGKELATLQRHEWRIFNLQFTADGKRLVSASADGSVKVWDMEGNRELRDFRADFDMNSAAFALSPDGKQLAGIGEGPRPLQPAVRVYELETGKEIAVLTGHRLPVRCLAYSPDGKRLASGGQDEEIKLWDIATGQALLSLPEQSGHIQSLVFSPNGHRLAASSPNGITIWDATPLDRKKGK